jgi:hypothetical protein
MSPPLDYVDVVGPRVSFNALVGFTDFHHSSHLGSVRLATESGTTFWFIRPSKLMANASRAASIGVVHRALHPKRR